MPCTSLTQARFFVHLSIRKLASSILERFGKPGEDCMLFPSSAVASRCRQFIKQYAHSTPPPTVRIIELVSLVPKSTDKQSYISSDLYAVLFPEAEFSVAKQFWQHSGDGVSSRRAEFCQREFDEGLLAQKKDVERPCKGPKRYSRTSIEKERPRRASKDVNWTDEDLTRFVEERFGRNLNIAFVDSAKIALRRRIAGTLKENVGLKDALELASESGRDVEGFSEEHVYLYPTGMNSIFNAHRILMVALGPRKSVSYGLAYGFACDASSH